MIPIVELFVFVNDDDDDMVLYYYDRHLMCVPWWIGNDHIKWKVWYDDDDDDCGAFPRYWRYWLPLGDIQYHLSEQWIQYYSLFPFPIELLHWPYTNKIVCIDTIGRPLLGEWLQ